MPIDLNRDWAWQTQVETQQRIKKYQEWMPQIHVDYHEQGFNEPYYFAPAAEPIHEVITPWQRDFQVMIGRNHAKYFDQNNWLFFTKERFDLLEKIFLTRMMFLIILTRDQQSENMLS